MVSLLAYVNEHNRLSNVVLFAYKLKVQLPQTVCKFTNGDKIKEKVLVCFQFLSYMIIPHHIQHTHIECIERDSYWTSWEISFLNCNTEAYINEFRDQECQRP